MADDVYLVMGGRGTVRISVNGRPASPVAVGGVPKLYTLFKASSKTTATLVLSASPGVEVYDFTFG